MDTLLRLSHGIDAMSRFIGKFIIWLVLAAAVISAANAVARKAFSSGATAFLEIQWYLFGAVFLLGAGYTFLQGKGPNPLLHGAHESNEAHDAEHAHLHPDNAGEVQK